MEQEKQSELSHTATMEHTYVRYEPHNNDHIAVTPRGLTEADRDLFKAFLSSIADQIRERFPDLPPFDDSKLEPFNVSTQISTHSLHIYQIELPSGHRVRASIIQPLGVPIQGGKIERSKMVHVERLK